MMNWAGFAFKCAQTDFQLGQDIMNIAAKSAASKAKQATMKHQSKNFEKEAIDFQKKAGKIQEAGRQERESRLVKLGQQEGGIKASAAGSGLAVESKTVKKVLKDTAVSAMNDVNTMAKNEAEAVHDAQNRELEARSNKVWNDMNIELEKKNAKLEKIGGIMSAASNWMGGMSSAMGSLMGGG